MSIGYKLACRAAARVLVDYLETPTKKIVCRKLRRGEGCGSCPYSAYNNGYDIDCAHLTLELLMQIETDIGAEMMDV